MKPPKHVPFISRLRQLTILDYEKMSPAALQRREFAEQQERQQWAEDQRRQGQARRRGGGERFR